MTGYQWMVFYARMVHCCKGYTGAGHTLLGWHCLRRRLELCVGCIPGMLPLPHGPLAVVWPTAWPGEPGWRAIHGQNHPHHRPAVLQHKQCNVKYSTRGQVVTVVTYSLVTTNWEVLDRNGWIFYVALVYLLTVFVTFVFKCLHLSVFMLYICI
jgi:hypothetical protein